MLAQSQGEAQQEQSQECRERAHGGVADFRGCQRVACATGEALGVGSFKKSHVPCAFASELNGLQWVLRQQASCITVTRISVLID